MTAGAWRGAVGVRLTELLEPHLRGRPLDPGARLLDQGFDSLSVFQLVVELEQEFGVSIGGAEIEAGVLLTPDSLLEFLSRSARTTAIADQGER